jgi:flotillin
MYGLYAVAALLFIALLAIILFKMMWRVAEPNEALIISGRRNRQPDNTDETLTFRIVTGGGGFIIPGLQTVRQLKLNLVQTDLDVDCVTNQGVRVLIKASVIFKIGDTEAEISNAARRFLDQQEQMVHQVHSIFSGHLRAIVGNMTVEALISDRDSLRENVRTASGTEMSNLGLKIDSLQLLEIGDPTKYIENLSKPHIAQAVSAARIAEAARDQEAQQAEAAASIEVAEAKTAAATRQAALKADADRAQAESAQAGPLAQARAQQEVTRAQTESAQLAAELRERQLETEIRKPADAAAYEATVRANAERDAAIARAEAEARTRTLGADANAQAVKVEAAANAEATRVKGEAEAAAAQAQGLAEAEAVKARGLAEAAAMSARATALAEGQDAVIAQQVAENLPAIVRELTAPFAAINNLTVLNGAEGLSQMVVGSVQQLETVLPGIMSALRAAAPGNSTSQDGRVAVTAEASDGR